MLFCMIQNSAKCLVTYYFSFFVIFIFNAIEFQLLFFVLQFLKFFEFLELDLSLTLINDQTVPLLHMNYEI